MPGYVPPIDDVALSSSRRFRFRTGMSSIRGWEGIDTDLAASILEEGGKFTRKSSSQSIKPGTRKAFIWCSVGFPMRRGV